MKISLFFIIFFTFFFEVLWAQDWKDLAPPEAGETWIRPVGGEPAQPVWGHVNGIRIALAPMPGPRGLIRIYTPYLRHEKEKAMNFFAFEPIVKGEDKRGLSELEKSQLDGVQGKRFWSSDDSLASEPREEVFPARGIIKRAGGTETLTVFIFSEEFENGAKVYTKIKFYAHKPYEIEISTYALEDSKELDQFIVTATMGNYARLRDLFLKNGKISSLELWPEYVGDHFTEHKVFSKEEFLQSNKKGAFFIAAPDEQKPQNVSYAKGTAKNWKYYGKKATQYWYTENLPPSLKGAVNGRFKYWGSKAPIPKGISFENFELQQPFKQGAKYVFGVSPLDPVDFIYEKIK